MIENSKSTFDSFFQCMNGSMFSFHDDYMNMFEFQWVEQVIL
jgi:hypothetical protein